MAAGVGAATGPVVVLGAAGYLGSHLVEHLEGRGLEVVGLTRDDCDLGDARATRQMVAELAPGTHLVHCAVIDRTVDPGLGALVENLAMTAGLARALEEHPPSSLLYLSTLDVYGRQPPLPITEQTPVAPESPYAIAKYASERVLLSSLERRCPVSVLRLPGVYGGNDPPKSIPRRFLDTILAGTTVRLHGGGTTRRDYLHVDDLCHVVAELLEQPSTVVLNVASGEALTIRGIVETLARSAGVEARIEPVPEAGDSAADLVLDTTELRRSLPGLRLRPLSVALAEYAARRARVR